MVQAPRAQHRVPAGEEGAHRRGRLPLHRYGEHKGTRPPEVSPEGTALPELPLALLTTLQPQDPERDPLQSHPARPLTLVSPPFAGAKRETPKCGLLKCREEPPKLLGNKFQERYFVIRDRRLLLLKEKRVPGGWT